MPVNYYANYCVNLSFAILYCIIVYRLEVKVMAYEVLRQLQQTESRADGIIKEAEEKGRTIIQESHLSAKTLLDEAKMKAISEGKSLINAEDAKAQQEADETLKRNNEFCRGLSDKARANISRAADLVVERIVTPSGNR